MPPILPLVFKEPPVAKVSIAAFTLPKLIPLIFTAVDIMGSFVNAVVPICTISVGPGGREPVPETFVQLAAVLQSLLAEPFQLTTPGISEHVQRETRLLIPDSST